MHPTTPAGPTVELRFLGPVEILVGDRPVVGLGPRAQGVLSVLALAGEAGVSRERLCSHLWPGSDPVRVRPALHAVVYRLRASAVGSAVETTAVGYRLTQVRRCDVHDLRRAVRLPLSDPRLLDDVVRSWRGEPFEGLDVEVLDLERGQLWEEYLSAVELLAERRLGEGAASHATSHLISRIDTLIREEPLRESLVRWQMLLLEGAGRRAEAMARYDRTRRTLDHQLGVTPAPMLEAEYLRILRAS